MVDGATLERLCGRKSTGGSNPPPSATVFNLENRTRTLSNSQHGNTRPLAGQAEVQKQQPVFAFGRFFRDNGDLMKKVFARFSTVRLAIVCANCRHGTGDLIRSL